MDVSAQAIEKYHIKEFTILQLLQLTKATYSLTNGLVTTETVYTKM